MGERLGPPLKRGPVLWDGHWATQPDSRSVERAIVTINLTAAPLNFQSGHNGDHYKDGVAAQAGLALLALVSFRHADLLNG